MNIKFEALGTQWSIDVYNAPQSVSNEKILELIQGRIAIFEKNYSRFRSDSLLMQMSQTAGDYTLPEDAKIMLQLYKKLYDVTGGAFTPLIGQVLEDAGYDASYSLKPKQLSSPPRWEDILEYNPPVLRIKKPAALDFGGVGKGYMVDIVFEILRELEIPLFYVDAGGDIRHFDKNKKEITVGLENPLNTKQVIGVAQINNQSICSSSGNRRAWGEYHHIINPHTLHSPKNILATWTVAATTIIADSLATSLFFTDGKILKKHFEFEYLVMYQDASIEKSKDFPAELYLKKTTETE